MSSIFLPLHTAYRRRELDSALAAVIGFRATRRPTIEVLLLSSPGPKIAVAEPEPEVEVEPVRRGKSKMRVS